jgi:hypothetical protein
MCHATGVFSAYELGSDAESDAGERLASFTSTTAPTESHFTHSDEQEVSAAVNLKQRSTFLRDALQFRSELTYCPTERRLAAWPELQPSSLATQNVRLQI